MCCPHPLERGRAGTAVCVQVLAHISQKRGGARSQVLEHCWESVEELVVEE